MLTATKKASIKKEQQPSNQAVKLYQKCLMALKGPNIARIVWFEILTEDERRQLGNNLGKAFSKYEAELNPFPHPRSLETIESNAMLRGSEVSLKKAEAFKLIKLII